VIGPANGQLRGFDPADRAANQATPGWALKDGVFGDCPRSGQCIVAVIEGNDERGTSYLLAGVVQRGPVGEMCIHLSAEPSPAMAIPKTPSSWKLQGLHTDEWRA